MAGFEPATSPIRTEHATKLRYTLKWAVLLYPLPHTLEQEQVAILTDFSLDQQECPRRDLNPRPLPCQGSALTKLSYPDGWSAEAPRCCYRLKRCFNSAMNSSPAERWPYHSSLKSLAET